MKLLIENWREYLEEEPKRSLGKYAFPHNKVNSDDDVEEPDTEWEKILAKLLDAHFGGAHHKAITSDVGEVIKTYLKYGEYPEVFKQYKGGKAYRGMSVGKAWFERKFGTLPDKPSWISAPIDTLKSRARKKAPSYAKYRPNEREDDFKVVAIASSWTTDISEAKQFATINLDSDDQVAIILAADSTKNVFLDAAPLYQFDFADSFESESEVIGLGDISVAEIIWLYKGKQ